MTIIRGQLKCTACGEPSDTCGCFVVGGPREIESLIETIDHLRSQSDRYQQSISHYHQALELAFPNGSSGRIWEHWNEALKLSGPVYVETKGVKT
jgi:hypothetical protein